MTKRSFAAEYFTFIFAGFAYRKVNGGFRKTGA